MLSLPARGDAVLIGASNLRADDPDLLPSHRRVERVGEEPFLGYAFDWTKWPVRGPNSDAQGSVSAPPSDASIDLYPKEARA